MNESGTRAKCTQLQRPGMLHFAGTGRGTPGIEKQNPGARTFGQNQPTWPFSAMLTAVDQ